MVRASLKRSRTIAGALFVAHALAGATVVPVHLPLWAKAAMVLVLGLSLFHAIYRHALLGTTRAVLVIEVKDQRTGAIEGRDGQWRDAQILGSTYVTPRLTVLNLRVSGERLARHVLVVPDNIEPEDFRKLRVLLRWSRAAAPEATRLQDSATSR